jgi:hypothetical protein
MNETMWLGLADVGGASGVSGGEASPPVKQTLSASTLVAGRENLFVASETAS